MTTPHSVLNLEVPTGRPSADTSQLYHMAARSMASRIVDLKGNNRGSVVGAFVAWLDGNWRTLVFESRHELMTGMLLLGTPGIENLFDQPPRVAYTGTDGRVHHHTFDFLVVINGKRYAVACKFRSTAERIHFREQLGLIKHQWQDFADEVLLVTEGAFSRERALQAELYHFIGREVDEEADAVVVRIADNLIGTCTIGSIVEASGLKARAFRAIVRLVGRRHLTIVGAGRIDHYETLVTRTIAS